MPQNPSPMPGSRSGNALTGAPLTLDRPKMRNPGAATDTQGPLMESGIGCPSGVTAATDST